MLSDLVVVEKRLERLDKDRKKIKNPELDREFELLEKCKALLEANQPLRAARAGRRRREAHPRLSVSFAEAHALRAESGRGRRRPDCTSAKSEYRDGPLQGRAARRSDGGVRQDRSRAGRAARARKQRDYLASYGLKESGLERLITATYRLLGLMSFLTAGENRSARLDHSHCAARR